MKFYSVCFLVLLCCLALIPSTVRVVHAEDENPTVDNGIRNDVNGGTNTDLGYSAEDRKRMEASMESHKFEAEVDRLMNIIINSLYSNKDIFLRELISNASDALDRIRFQSLTDASLLGDKPELEIKIRADPDNNMLYIMDSGIGMTKEDLVNNLGTIAQSGTKAALNNALEEGENLNSLIGQFGVGFYSSFLVADEVIVATKNNDSEQQYVWESDATNNFKIYEDPKGNTLKRGTRIGLKLKEDMEDYLDEEFLENLIRTYSEFITFPIYLYKSHEETEEIDLTQEELDEQLEEWREQRKAEKEAEKAEEEDEETVDLDAEEEETKDEEEEEEEEVPDLPTTKSVTKTVYAYERINDNVPLWTRSKDDISEDEYNSFYTALTRDDEEPLSKIHFVAEGDVEFRSILYIPKKIPAGVFERVHTTRGVKLYVRKVFITDKFDDIIPQYLGWLRGVVDSDDLPLNVSREILQQDRALTVIKKKLVRKAIHMIQGLAKDAEIYKDFWEQYAMSIKLGIIEDAVNRTRLSKLLRFQSSKSDELRSFEEYVEDMKEGQKQIYYLPAATIEEAKTSPLAERLIRKGFEVLYMVDNLDEYALQQLSKFDGTYPLTNVAKEKLKFDGEDEEAFAALEDEFKPVAKFLKTALGDQIDKAVVSNRLTSSAAALAAASWGYSGNMERIMKAQSMGDPNARKTMYAPKKTLEINPRHPIIRELKNQVEADAESEAAKDTAQLLLDGAILSSGYSLDDNVAFAQRLEKVIKASLNIDPDAVAEEEEEVEEAAEDVEEGEEGEEEDGEDHVEL